MPWYKSLPLVAGVLLILPHVEAQKKPLDHSVYDSWQTIGERIISPNGKWIAYGVDPQEGDNELVIQSADQQYKLVIPRGYLTTITADSRYLICRIKPPYKDAREARIKKKRPEESPKDSLAILELGKQNILKLPRAKGFRVPEKSGDWLAYQLEKITEPGKPRATDNRKATDSLLRVIDSLKTTIAQLSGKPSGNKDNDPTTNRDAEGDAPVVASPDAGADLVLRKLYGGAEKIFHNVQEYYFNENGRKLLIKEGRNPQDSLSQPLVLLYDLRKGFADTISRGGNEFRNFILADDGSQVAYLAERSAKPKDLQKFFQLWYYQEGMDSAVLLADRLTPGMNLGMTVSENGSLSFSKNGSRLFFGVAPVQPARDTTLVETELAKLDVWHYNDDYLQTVQLSRLQRDLQQNFLAVCDLSSRKLVQLANEELPLLYPTKEGDGEFFIGVTDFGRRVESQWTGSTKKDIYAVRVSDGNRRLIKKELSGTITPAYISPGGKYISWYDDKARSYFVYNGDTVRNIGAGIKTALYDEENDTPDDPNPYGVMGWAEGDSALFVYDRYDIWQLDADGPGRPVNLTGGKGRSANISYRYIRTDPDERFIASGKDWFIRSFHTDTKKAGISLWKPGDALTGLDNSLFADKPCSYGVPRKAKDASVFIYSKESYTNPPDLYLSDHLDNEQRLSFIDPQQREYNWGTAELYNWTTFKGKPSQGILYKPEDFDPAKKYPIIFYFYERLSDGLYNYIPPTPTPSRLNISFFVSRGYLVFAPDIRYTTGHPAQSAYDYVVSAATDLAKNKWVDGKNMAIQGQSWGGIQVAQLVTMTDLFKAAWAGAPVANMTSAYGGIRWETGVTRQFQYEKQQSRIGATLWEKPELYIENSPLFHVPNVKTPLVIMSNDADGAVPWYQGIELFTAMRRLGKKVWMLTYNGEAHNLVQRRNQKDIQVREQEYFDWMLKGAKPAKWLIEGVPAVKKGKDWGLDLEP